MRTGDLAKQFGVSNTTVQEWSRLYSDFLSPKRGVQRVYDENDLLVLATVAYYRHQSESHEDITARLERGERVDDAGTANFGIDTRMVPAAAVEQIIDGTEMRVELELVKQERDQLAETLKRAEERYEKLQDTSKEELREAREETSKLLQEIARLQNELGRAQGELEYRRSRDD